MSAVAPIKVMLVDDSAIVRGLMVRALEAIADIEVVATAVDGQMAIETAKHHELDVIILDIEMPVMDGINALPLLIKTSPFTKIIMASTLTLRNADISMEALQLGASDYLPKPTSRNSSNALEEFHRELAEKVTVLGIQAQRERQQPTELVKADAVPATPITHMSITMPSMPPQALAFSASTGGPQALMHVLKHVREYVSGLPIFITQHMPAAFTTILADHISKETGLRCIEPLSGEMVAPNTIFLAPGDHHMVIEEQAHKAVITLTQDPPVNFCRPSADPMLTSLSEYYGSSLLAVTLTGMGQDGLDGAYQVVRENGTVIVQDEESSVVWGMPGAVAKAGIASAVLSLEHIAAYIIRARGAR